MMNKINIAKLVFLVIFFISCKVTDKTPTEINHPKKDNTFPCELCDFWINVEKAHLPKEKYLVNTFPYVDETITTNDVIVKNYDFYHAEAIFPEGPLKVYRQLEWNRAKALRFCFIGKTRKELKVIFAAKAYQTVSTKNGLHFNSFIEHAEAESASYKINSPSDICSSLSQGRYF